MKRTKNMTQENIIQTTTQLIRENEDLSQITIRDIASKADVGVGLVNYHFQTKDNLIDICVLRIVSQFIEEIERLYADLQMSPIDKLKYVFKVKCAFLVANPKISKTSMILDFNAANLEDNTHQAAKIHYEVMKELYGDKKTDSEIFMILHILMSSIQVAFLRNSVIKLDTGLDFYDEVQRDNYVENLIDFVLRDLQ